MAPRANRRCGPVSRPSERSSKSAHSPTIPSTEVPSPSHSSCFLEEGILLCEICLDIMHNAMKWVTNKHEGTTPLMFVLYTLCSVSPCNHKFCAGCIYEWNSINPKCPKCRWRVVDITRDTAFNIIIDQYLNAYPDRDIFGESWSDNNMDEDYEERDDSIEMQDEGDWMAESDEWSDGGSYDSTDEDIADKEEYDARRKAEKSRIERLRQEKENREKAREQERQEAARLKREQARREKDQRTKRTARIGSTFTFILFFPYIKCILFYIYALL
uniref:RING-type domain-containing protein n=1 Tax=Heterorhabditis bacteriophora TaxID=37862 RepID=A0A1I7X929_HETBA